MFDLIPDMAAKRAELTPHKVAFETEDRKWTYASINRAAEGVAAGLVKLGVRRGDRLAVLSLNRAEFFIALFACQKSGIIMAPLNWRQPVPELVEVLGSVKASAVLFDQQNSESGRALADQLSLISISMETCVEDDVSFSALMDLPPIEHESIDASAPWYLLFTSGTTGLPKAVIQTARMCWASALNVAQAAGINAKSLGVNYLPLFHTGGINVYTMPIFLFGGTSTILPKFEPDLIMELIKAEKVTQFFGVPAIFQAFSLHKDVDRVNWKKVKMGCGGAPLPEFLIDFFAERGAMICNGYGMTESGPTGLLMDREHAAEKLGSVGRAQMLTELRLDGVPDDQAGEGEILLRGPSVTPGYFKNPEATEKTFTSDGWLKSGDVGRRDEDGYIFIIDRIKDMYISGGENVYPAEVERTLSNHPDILESAVIGVSDDKWGEVGAAFLTIRPGRALDIETLVPWCRERLAAYKVPKTFKIVEDFSRTAAGKIRKPDLRKLLS